MNHSMDKFPELASKYLDDNLTQEEFDLFVQLLSQYPDEAGDLLYDFALQHVSLRRILSVTKSLLAEGMPLPDERIDQERFPSQKRIRWLRVPTRLALVVNMILVLFIGGILFHEYSDHWHRKPANEVTAELVPKGGVVFLHRGDAVFQHRDRLGIQRGNLIQTPLHNEAALVFHDATRVDIEAGSLVSVSNYDEYPTSGNTVFVHSGKISADITPQPEEHPMHINTPHVVIRIVGTKLECTVDSNSTHVSVTRGSVLVIEVSTRSSHEIKEGESIRIPPLNEGDRVN